MKKHLGSRRPLTLGIQQIRILALEARALMPVAGASYPAVEYDLAPRRDDA